MYDRRHIAGGYKLLLNEYEWMNEWMNEWVSDRVSEWVNERTNEY